MPGHYVSPDWSEPRFAAHLTAIRAAFAAHLARCPKHVPTLKQLAAIDKVLGYEDVAA